MLFCCVANAPPSPVTEPLKSLDIQERGRKGFIEWTMRPLFLMVSALCDKLLRPFQFLYRRDEDLAFGSCMLGGRGWGKLPHSKDCLPLILWLLIRMFTDDVAREKVRKKKVEMSEVNDKKSPHFLAFSQAACLHLCKTLQSTISSLYSTVLLLQMNDEAQPSCICLPNLFQQFTHAWTYMYRNLCSHFSHQKGFLINKPSQTHCDQFVPLGSSATEDPWLPYSDCLACVSLSIFVGKS